MLKKAIELCNRARKFCIKSVCALAAGWIMFNGTLVVTSVFKSLDSEVKILMSAVIALFCMIGVVEQLNEDDKFTTLKVVKGGIALTPNQLSRVQRALRSAYYRLESEGQGGEESENCKTADQMLTQIVDLEGGDSESAETKAVQQT